MHIPRVTSLLQGVADVRNWVVQNIPAAATPAGYDLFIQISVDYLGGKPLLLDRLSGELPHDGALLRDQLSQLEQAGLIVEQAGAGLLLPTAAFVALIDRYQAKFGSLFIPRQHLRDEQLHVQTGDGALRQFAELLYDHFYDMGWLYLHNFGGVCFLMASLVQRAAIAGGHRARVESGYVEVSDGARKFLLGAQGYATPGQIEGHAFCIVDESLILDFGLGNLRTCYRRDFSWALACPYRPQGAVLGEMTLPDGQTVRWKNDWQTPQAEAELEKYAPLVDTLFTGYLAHFS